MRVSRFLLPFALIGGIGCGTINVGDDDVTQQTGDDDASQAATTTPTGDDDASVQTTPPVDVDQDGYPAPADCDDNNAAVHPGASEACNGKDDNCDEKVDEGLNLTTYYRDADADTYGASQTIQACLAPAGYVTNNTDCNDSNATVHPGAVEQCNNVDDNCDGQVDNGIVTLTFYIDGDKDGYGLANQTTTACLAPVGYALVSGDCNDADASIRPSATETCNGVDDNCNGTIDDGVATQTWYRDADGDGYGTMTDTKQACSQPAGYLPKDSDCNDANNTIYPGAAEVCDGVDNNCNGKIDEAATSGLATYYADADKDGYGNSAVTTQACSQPAGYVTDKTDCNDSNATTYPGAVEIANNIDDNCNGQVDEGVDTDADRDGYTPKQGDCNDADASIHPNATESCNGKDDDCNGVIDNGLSTSAFYKDADGDGYGAAANGTQACKAPAGYVANSTDCNDADKAIYPGATELCNSKDDDCNGQIDEGVIGNTYYRDGDGDGYGSASSMTRSCSAPTGYVTDHTDCDDTKVSVHPGATESCNGLDDNCDGLVDNGATNTTWYKDADADGYGLSASSTATCAQPTGYVAKSGDCDDTKSAVYPGATETCNSVDDDCDGQVDENGTNTYYRDLDGDTYGDTKLATTACSAPTGYVTSSTDCNDTDKAIYPGAVETCNSKDDNCNGTIDENLSVSTFYKDGDADGYGLTAVTTTGTCGTTAPTGYATKSGDCDDVKPAVNPGATEQCDNKVDDNCDGQIDNNDLCNDVYVDDGPDKDGVLETVEVNQILLPVTDIYLVGEGQGGIGWCVNTTNSALKVKVNTGIFPVDFSNLPTGTLKWTAVSTKGNTGLDIATSDPCNANGTWQWLDNYGICTSGSAAEKSFCYNTGKGFVFSVTKANDGKVTASGNLSSQFAPPIPRETSEALWKGAQGPSQF